MRAGAGQVRRRVKQLVQRMRAAATGTPCLPADCFPSGAGAAPGRDGTRAVLLVLQRRQAVQQLRKRAGGRLRRARCCHDALHCGAIASRDERLQLWWRGRVVCCASSSAGSACGGGVASWRGGRVGLASTAAFQGSSAALSPHDL